MSTLHGRRKRAKFSGLLGDPPARWPKRVLRLRCCWCDRQQVAGWRAVATINAELRTTGPILIHTDPEQGTQGRGKLLIPER